MKKLKMMAVSYLNTKPFLFGLKAKGLEDVFDIDIDYPSKCAERLKNEEVDLALVPVAVLPELGTYHLVSDYCIGCDGEVKTVCIFSHKPLEQVKQIYLDFHSKTSLALAKILLKEYWQMDIPMIDLNLPIGQEYGEDTAIVAIGDKTIALSEYYRYTYDLGAYWKQLTGLPFVFAVWVSKKPIDPLIKLNLEEAFAFGLKNIESVIKSLPAQNENFDLKKYYEKNISYDLNALKLKALALFLSKIRSNESTISDKILIA